MSKFIINGGKPLYGNVRTQGSKNSAVAVLIASIITDGVSEITGVPDISDVRACLELLECLGIKTEFCDEHVTLDTSGVKKAVLPCETVKKMRASSYLIGAELVRFGECTLPDSGGCNFGIRPVNYHVSAMKSLGAEEKGGKLFCCNLKGNSIVLPYPSVGATVNAVIAASRSNGVTIIENSAREPHIVDLVNYLNSCGADIQGAGSSILRVNGKSRLHGGKIKLSPDMIESGTYLIYGLLTGGKVTSENTAPEQLCSLLKVFQKMGVKIDIKRSSVSVSAKYLHSCDVTTAPYPDFPTDLQPQMAVLMGKANGVSHIKETVFAKRFGYVKSLEPFGFCSKINERCLEVYKSDYHNAVSNATDLRGGAAIIGAALSSDGKSVISTTELIKRGYSSVVKKLSLLGADVTEL